MQIRKIFLLEKISPFFCEKLMRLCYAMLYEEHECPPGFVDSYLRTPCFDLPGDEQIQNQAFTRILPPLTPLTVSTTTNSCVM